MLLACIHPIFPPNQTPKVPWTDTVATFLYPLTALPLPTGLGETQMSPLWGSSAGSPVPSSFTYGALGTNLTVLYLFKVSHIRP